jgi:crotonobetainyl-CoA:carnitine CoA-transferase CaiB-like acyl-CoA transferase
VTRDLSGNPHLVGSTYPDQLTGAYTALLVQQALAARAQTGAGCRVEVSMLDVALMCMGGLVAPAVDGESLGVHPVRFSPTAEPERYVAIVSDEVRDCTGLTRREAMRSLQAEGVRAGAVLDMREVMADEHLSARSFVVADEHPVARGRSMPGVAWLYDGVRPSLAHAPLLGEGTREVLERLTHLTANEIEALEEAGVLV